MEYRESSDARNIFSIDEYTQRFFFEPATFAHRAEIFRPDVFGAESMAGIARAIGAIKREQARLDFRERESVVRARELRGKCCFLVSND